VIFTPPFLFYGVSGIAIPLFVKIADNTINGIEKNTN
jgi:hypothetical protein